MNNIKLPVKITDIHKIKIKNSIGISVFGYKNKEKQRIYVSKKCCEEKHVDLLMIAENLIKDSNTFMYDHTLHRGREHFCHYCLQAFSAEDILKSHIKDCFKSNGKYRIIMPKKGEFVQFKNYQRKIKSPFIIYADFESILVPKMEGKTQKILTETNIKSILLSVMDIN